MRKLITFALVGALALVSMGASCGSVKDNAGKVIVTAETALHLVVTTELAMRCGEVTALPAPNCITPEKHAGLKAKLLQAEGFIRDARDIYNLLPATGSPSISAITQIIVKVAEIIQQVLSGIPDTTAQMKLAAEPSVAKTLAVRQ